MVSDHRTNRGGVSRIGNQGVAWAEDSEDDDRLFAPVNTGRLSEEIVEQIKLAIRTGQLEPGDRLPPERELAARFGVSRVSVRDALRILEAGGLIEIRVGARGGAYMTAPGSAMVGEGIAHMLMLSSISAGEVAEARIVFELAVVPLVCERATDDDLAVLTEICEESAAAVANGDYRVELSARFHIAFARATHNNAIGLLIESFREPLLMSLERAREAVPNMGRTGVKEHRALVEAVRRRDVENARRIMARHLGRTRRRLAEIDRTRS